MTIYRAVQEALTNVLKHAGPDARVEVALTWSDHSLTVCVDDDGGYGSDATHPVAAGPGRGLTGMRDRVAQVGGSVTATPRPHGGFALRVVLPIVPRVLVS